MPDYEITITQQAVKSGSYTIEATANRNIITADVLDYDGYNGNYALIWKKITISHSQRKDTTASGQETSDTYDNSVWGDLDWAINFTVNDSFTSLSTRTVEFYLTYNIGGTKFEKLLCTCTMTSRYGTGIETSQTFSGERVWGASIQVYTDFMVYQFRKEEPVDGLNRNWGGSQGGSYDGNYAFEGWMVDRDETLLWKLKSHVVGLINISDGVDSEVGYLKEEEYTVGEEGNVLSSGEIYSVGVVNEL
jgi:hypothetical protein